MSAGFQMFLVILIVAFLWSRSRRDDTDGHDERSGMCLYTDHKTGLQYISAGPFGGLSPRLDADGTHMRVSAKETKQ